MRVDPRRLAAEGDRAARALIGSSRRPLTRLWRRWYINQGRDVTGDAAGRSCVVVAAHPDEETIGAGGVIARKRAHGTPVDVVIVTDGRHSHRSRWISPSELAQRRAAEARAATAMLGVEPDRLHLLGYEELTLHRIGPELVAVLHDLFEATTPDEILVCSELDRHRDHCVVHHAVRRAAAGLRHGPTLLAYPVTSWEGGPWSAPPTARVRTQLRTLVPDLERGLRLPPPRLVALDRFAALKKAAFSRYESQTTNLTGEADWSVRPDAWLSPFVDRYEVFFPVVPDRPGEGGEGGARRRARHLAGADRTGVAVRGDPSASGVSAASLPLLDDFTDARPPGTVVGSPATSGHPRLGLDVEGTLSVDHDELRLGSLARPGWGRQGIAYGPFTADDGLTMAVTVLNAHQNASSGLAPEGRRALLRRLAAELPEVRLVPPAIADNLVVGLHDDPDPSTHPAIRHGFVMHAGGLTNGELRCLVAGRTQTVRRAVPDVPLHLVVTHRGGGAVYFGATFGEGDAGPAGGTPAGAIHLRPLAVAHRPRSSRGGGWCRQRRRRHANPLRDDRPVGPRRDRLPRRDPRRPRRRDIPPRAGTPRPARLSDPLTGTGGIADDGARPGGAAAREARGRAGSDRGSDPPPTWSKIVGDLRRDAIGLHRAGDGPASALTAAPEPPGLIALRIVTASRIETARAVLGFRLNPSGDRGWRVLVGRDRAWLERADSSGWVTVATAPCELTAATSASLQVIDTGTTFGIHLDGTRLFEPVDDPLGAREHGIAIGIDGPGGIHLADLEAWPRLIAAPAATGLQRMGDLSGSVVVCDETFEGEAGELTSTSGGPTSGWHRSEGHGRLARTGLGGARVVADNRAPNPDRTIYTRPWGDVGFADLTAEVLPPGRARSQGHGCRAGLVFWQDSANYLVVNAWLDDSPDHDGSSVSLFFRDRGTESPDEALWTNVARDITWGRPFELRAAFDGHAIVVRLDGRPVLYRRTTDIHPDAPALKIERIGLAVNREWGGDTGSVFRRLVARER